MEKDSAIYQLMDTRMNGVMNGIVSGDGEYQAILRKSDIYSSELDRMDLSKEIRLLIDRYVSEQNALGSRFGMLAYLLGFFNAKFIIVMHCPCIMPIQSQANLNRTSTGSQLLQPINKSQHSP